jgi:hypothetical protein
MTTVIDNFKQLEAHHRVKDAIYYLTRLFNELGFTSQRNQYAYLKLTTLVLIGTDGICLLKNTSPNHINMSITRAQKKLTYKI